MEYKRVPERLLRHLFSAPFIYIIIFPLVILDIFIEPYKQIRFRLCGIELIRRKNYIRID